MPVGVTGGTGRAWVVMGWAVRCSTRRRASRTRWTVRALSFRTSAGDAIGVLVASSRRRGHRRPDDDLPSDMVGRRGRARRRRTADRARDAASATTEWPRRAGSCRSGASRLPRGRAADGVRAATSSLGRAGDRAARRSSRTIRAGDGRGMRATRREGHRDRQVYAWSECPRVGPRVQARVVARSRGQDQTGPRPADRDAPPRRCEHGRPPAPSGRGCRPRRPSRPARGTLAHRRSIALVHPPVDARDLLRPSGVRLAVLQVEDRLHAASGSDRRRRLPPRSSVSRG